MNFDAAAFKEMILRNRILGFSEAPITLASGAESHYYVNWRTASNDVFLLDKTSSFVLEYVEDLIRSGKIGEAPETYFGVAEGATKLGIITQYKFAKSSPEVGIGSHVLAMGRGKQKAHGKLEDRDFVGVPKGRTIVLEDVTTSGGSLIQAIRKLREVGVDVLAAIALTNRHRAGVVGVEREMQMALNEGEAPVKYFAMSHAADLIQGAFLRWDIEEDLKRKVLTEIEECDRE